MLSSEKGGAKEVIPMKMKWCVSFILLCVALFVNGVCAADIVNLLQASGAEK
jgi:hypothetical protein